MKKPLACLTAVFLAVTASAVTGCNGGPARVSPIVGTWVVDDAGAPFPFHMYVFNADGTMQQANPDAGDATTSDSDGKGVWVAEGDHIKGKWVEILADRTTHKFTGTLALSLEVKVDQDKFAGTSSASFFDASGAQTGTAKPTALTGKRVTLP